MSSRTAAVWVSLAVAVVLAGCTTPAGSELGSMGASKGYISDPSRANMVVARDQRGAETLEVRRVESPVDGWLIVRSGDSEEAIVAGRIRVPAGASRDLHIPLHDIRSEIVEVTLLADKGRVGRFDYDPKAPLGGTDRPLYVDRKELMVPVQVRDAGIEAPFSQLDLYMLDQLGVTDSLSVSFAKVPGPSWVTVDLDDGGVPGRRVGLYSLPAGEHDYVSIPLDTVPLTSYVFVTLHADRGTPGNFEYSYERRFDSPDRPYVSNGVLFRSVVQVRRAAEGQKRPAAAPSTTPDPGM